MNQRYTAHKLKEEDFVSLWKMVGNTPLIEISYRYQGGPVRQVLVKCEQYNLTGSIKDRLALYILQKAYHLGTIRPDDTIVNASIGNTGIAFAAIGKALGHRVKLFIPDDLSDEQVEIIRSFGAQIMPVSEAEGGFPYSAQLAEAEVKKGDVFLTQQLERLYHVQVQERTTGWEIWNQLQTARKRPLAFIAGVGTGGTVRGIGNHLRSVYPDIKVYPLGAAENKHRIAGISGELLHPASFDQLEATVQVNDGDAILMAQLIARQLSVGVGISSGANFLGAVKIQQQSPNNSAVITVFPDSNNRYQSAILGSAEPSEGDYLTPAIELVDYRDLSGWTQYGHKQPFQ